jgi:hypothetical protein
VKNRARPAASRSVAARVLRGGRSSSETANATAVAASSAIAAHSPTGPVVASRCPGSGLAAGVRCRVSPRGNRTAFCSVEPGERSAAGADAAIAAMATSTEVRANRAAAFGSRRAASITAMTGMAGQAVTLSAQAIPPATPAVIPARHGRRACRGAGQASASVTQSAAMTGMSVSPVATCRDRTGEAIAMAAHRSVSAVARSGIRSASQTPAAPARASHSRGLPAQPVSPAAPGSPKAAISGSYGSYASTCDRLPAGRYGVPCRSSCTPACRTTVSEPSPARLGRPTVACQASGAAVAQASAMSAAAVPDAARARGNARMTAAAR